MKQPVEIDLAECAKETGKSEMEIAKAIEIILAIKAEVYGIPQKILCVVRK